MRHISFGALHTYRLYFLYIVITFERTISDFLENFAILQTEVLEV